MQCLPQKSHDIDIHHRTSQHMILTIAAALAAHPSLQQQILFLSGSGWRTRAFT